MSVTVHIESAAHFSQILSSSRLVVTDFYADWCGPCKAVAPIYEQLSQHLSRPGLITFTKVNTDHHKDITQTYGVTAMPTFMIFRGGREIKRIRGADPKALDAAVRQVAQEAAKAGEASGSGEAAGGAGASGGMWTAMPAPRGYADITDAVEIGGLDFLNLNGDFGHKRVLFEKGQPSALSSKIESSSSGTKDWVESDTDEQMMLYIPFQSTVKLHTIHITSIVPSDATEAPPRPRVLRFYKNLSNALGFDDGNDAPNEQEVEIKESDWDAKTATAKVELRFVRFQNITSLNIFVVSGGEEEKTRIDRIRFFGETGEKRAMAKLEKMGEDS